MYTYTYLHTYIHTYMEWLRVRALSLYVYAYSHACTYKCMYVGKVGRAYICTYILCMRGKWVEKVPARPGVFAIDSHTIIYMNIFVCILYIGEGFTRDALAQALYMYIYIYIGGEGLTSNALAEAFSAEGT